MLRSQITESFGMLIVIQLITEWPDYKVQNTVWDVEGSDWVTEDSDKMFYNLEDKK